MYKKIAILKITHTKKNPQKNKDNLNKWKDISCS